MRERGRRGRRIEEEYRKGKRERDRGRWTEREIH